MRKIKFTPRQIRALQRCEEASSGGACSHWLSHHTAMSVPQISATLRQLKAHGLVSDGKENSPYYHCMWSLTEAGKQALAATRSTLPELDAEMGEAEG